MRALIRTVAVIAVLLISATAASAQVVPSIQIGVGGFFPRGFDGRPDGDVLIGDLLNDNPLAFNIGDFRGGQVSGEYNVAFGRHIEVGFGAGFYSRTVPSVYRNVININGSEIEQDLRLRMTPVTGVVRFLFGDPARAQGYVGAGITAVNWRYSEVGEFVDLDDNIFSARFVANGTATGPVLLAGVRFGMGGDIYAFTIEGRQQFATGDIDVNKGFLGDRIDLTGMHLTFGVLVRF